MPKPRNLIPTIQLNLALPQDLHARLTLHLYSELEGRVPHGAYSRFFVERLNEFFSSTRLDLAPFAGCEPDVFTVAAGPATIRVLHNLLKGNSDV